MGGTDRPITDRPGLPLQLYCVWLVVGSLAPIGNVR